ncbi:hypothetical protein ETB97_001938 [Aspergillus alliaceus]|uniref:Uncharacterized protein n=1 Tax=Petromyces alliaceus TaxID=209559 RepID=A0A8H6AC59_PETAA|nr:hypothetical protein ETB97_001938 [Aspergillus burnettii]
MTTADGRALTMSTDIFHVTEHTAPACHIREYPGSTVRSQEEALALHVKQYTPLEQADPIPVSTITIIAAHAYGFPKELYKPLWDVVHYQLKQNGFYFRSIWMADMSSMGQSGVIKEKISNDYATSAHGESAKVLVGIFCTSPLVIHHTKLRRPNHPADLPRTNLALMCPRLPTTVVLLDPVIQPTVTQGLGTDPPRAVNYALRRPDIWPNRKTAASAHAKLWRRWDCRCVELMIKFGFGDLPTALYPEMPKGTDPSNPAMTLTTSKYREFLGFSKLNSSVEPAPDGKLQIGRSIHADLDPVVGLLLVCHPESRGTFLRLPNLRPPALWNLGAKSFLGLNDARKSIKNLWERGWWQWWLFPRQGQGGYPPRRQPYLSNRGRRSNGKLVWRLDFSEDGEVLKVRARMEQETRINESAESSSAW